MFFLAWGRFYEHLGVLCGHKDALCLLDLNKGFSSIQYTVLRIISLHIYMTLGLYSKISFTPATFFVSRPTHEPLTFMVLCSFIKHSCLTAVDLADWSISCSPEHKIKQNFNEAAEIVHLNPNQIFSDAFKEKPHLTLSDSRCLVVVWSLPCLF